MRQRLTMEKVDRVIELAQLIATKAAEAKSLAEEVATLRAELGSYISRAPVQAPAAGGRPALTGKTLPVRALEIMRRNPGQSMAPVDFAQALGVKPKTMRTVLARLVKAGHVERVDIGKYQAK